jgi:hypothetical protein
MPVRRFLCRANSTSHGMLVLMASAMCWLVFIHGARAASPCPGTYSASLVHPVQSRGVMLPDRGRPALTDLRGRFVDGLHRGGLVTAEQSTTRLGFVAMATPAPGMVSSVPGTMHGLGWALDTAASGDSVMAATLLVTVTLTNTQTFEISWVFSLQCKVMTEDRGLIVERIGEIIGRSAGKEVQSTRF